MSTPTENSIEVFNDKEVLLMHRLFMLLIEAIDCRLGSHWSSHSFIPSLLSPRMTCLCSSNRSLSCSDSRALASYLLHNPLSSFPSYSFPMTLSFSTSSLFASRCVWNKESLCFDLPKVPSRSQSLPILWLHMCIAAGIQQWLVAKSLLFQAKCIILSKLMFQFKAIQRLSLSSSEVPLVVS